MYHTLLHEKTKLFMQGFHYDAHPMGMLVSTVGALSTFYPDDRNVADYQTRLLQVYRLIGKMPTIASYTYRNSMGFPYIYPDATMSYTGNFLNMMYRMPEPRYQPDPVLEDDYFVERKLYPNVDFYSGLIYEAMEFPTSIFTVLFAIPRTAGWVAQWLEQMVDKEQKIARPRQQYIGPPKRDFVPLEKR